VRNVFLYLDRTFANQTVGVIPVGALGQREFRSAADGLGRPPGEGRARVVRAIAGLVHRERAGESLEPSLLRRAVGLALAAGWWGTWDASHGSAGAGTMGGRDGDGDGNGESEDEDEDEDEDGDGSGGNAAGAMEDGDGDGDGGGPADGEMGGKDGKRGSNGRSPESESDPDQSHGVLLLPALVTGTESFYQEEGRVASLGLGYDEEGGEGEGEGEGDGEGGAAKSGAGRSASAGGGLLARAVGRLLQDSQGTQLAADAAARYTALVTRRLHEEKDRIMTSLESHSAMGPIMGAAERCLLSVRTPALIGRGFLCLLHEKRLGDLAILWKLLTRPGVNIPPAAGGGTGVEWRSAAEGRPEWNRPESERPHACELAAAAALFQYARTRATAIVKECCGPANEKQKELVPRLLRLRDRLDAVREACSDSQALGRAIREAYTSAVNSVEDLPS